ncbi:dctM, partial [Symbiodinium necroappetens]
FAAVSASSLATTATMGLVAMPEMRKHNYNVSMASGSVVAGGTIGSLIPPSGMFIIYGILTETSIGKMFAAGIIPGILLALFYMIAIAIWCRLDPNAGPRGPKYTLKEKLWSFTRTGEVIVLFALVMGGIVLGWFTPTEAGAIGAFGAIVVSVARRRLTWAAARTAIYSTLKTTGMIFGILFGALVFNSFITASTIPLNIVNFVTDSGLPPMAVLFLVLGVYFVLGMVLDASAMMTLTIPLFFPLMMNLGFDAILFGVLVVRMTEIALITPPVGMNVYILSGVVKDIPLEKIFKGALPFVAADILHVAMLPPAKRGWGLVTTTGVLTGFGHGFVAFAVSALLKPIALDLETSRGAVSTAIGLGRLASGIASPIVGRATDRSGARGVVVLGMVLTALGLVALGFVQTEATLYLAWSVLVSAGVAAGFTVALDKLVVASIRETRGMALAMRFSVAAVVSTLLVPFVTVLVDTVGWRNTCSIWALVILALLPIPLLTFERHTPPQPPASGIAKNSAGTVRSILVQPALWLIAFAFMAQAAVVTGLSVHLVPLMTDNGLTATVAGTLFGGMILLSVPVRLLAGVVADRAPISVLPIFLAILLVLEA